MDAKENSADTHRKIYRGIATALVCAVLEWLLLSMLFVDAIFAFIITKYARFYKLQTPCLLCSRLDHVLGSEKRGYYWDLICGNHKSEISSLVISHADNKLVDLATISKSNAQTCRSLEGKLQEDHDSCCDQNKLLESCQSSSSSSMNDSCCGEPLILERELIQAKSTVFEATEHGVPSSDAAAGSTDNEMQQTKTDLSVSLGATPSVDSGFGSELKVTSEPKSEVLFLDNDEESAIVCENDNPKELQVQHVQLEPLVVTLPEDSSTESLIDRSSVTDPTVSEPLVVTLAEDSSTEKLMDRSSVTDPSVLEPHVVSLAEDSSTEKLINQSSVTDPSVLEPILVTLAEDSSTEKLIDRSSVTEPSVLEPLVVTLAEDSNIEKPIDQSSVTDPSVLEPIVATLAEDSSRVKLIDQASVTDPSVLEPQVQPVDSCGALPAVSTVSNDNDLAELNCLQVEGKSEPSTIPELISFDVAPSVEVSNESLNVTTRALEQTSVSGSENVCAAETVAITRTSTSTGPQSSNMLDLGDAYKVALESKEKQLTDVLGEPWTERNSSKASADFRRLLSQLSAARGFDQSIYDMSPRLSINDDVSNSIGMHIFQKRILERNESGLSMDGSIVSIVSEVDGESLVDRLRRQIEHDRKSMSGLYKELEEERNASTIAANQAMAMITKLQEEKASLNMEASQYLRMMEEQSEYDTETLQRLTDLLAEKEKEIQDLEEELEFYKRKYPNESTMENSEVAIVRNSIAENELPGDENLATVAKSLLEFEDESSYILHSLKKLEKRLLLFSNNGVHSDLDNSQYAEEQSLPSIVDLKSVNKENDGLIHDLANIRNEVYDLNDRLRTLKADRSFLEHAINSLRNGNEGVQFIQEIASHLRELRKIGTNRRDQPLT